MAQSEEKGERASSLCFLLDLDGTLVDSVYLHVLAWQEAFQGEKIDIPS
jgi:beta-phosphoglucomutase-like phosphatase (HAD superfamily)